MENFILKRFDNGLNNIPGPGMDYFEVIGHSEFQALRYYVSD